MNGRFLLILFITICGEIFPVSDSLVIYNVQTGKISYIAPAAFDTSVKFENTEWNYGNIPGFQKLSLIPPDSTYNESGFTDYMPARNFYSTSDYPIRTAVKIFHIINDSLKQKCSGLMVAKNYVLTDCHCIGSYDSNNVFKFQDSILLAPAYDNGAENPLFGHSMGTEYITFRDNMSSYLLKDLALIKLDRNSGYETGWIGIAFNDDDSFFKNNIFHKLSYPATIDAFDSSRVYNGDTLYYNYGVPGEINDTWIGYNIFGIRGQSGSSLFFTDNERYFSIGTLKLSTMSYHTRIIPGMYYAFKQFLEPGISSSNDDNKTIKGYKLSEAYPNPFNSATLINYTIPEQEIVNITAYNALGEETAVIVNDTKDAGNYTILFDGAELSSGVYYLRLRAGSFMQTRKIVLLK
jgi:V8-like Glu-specific endopeptidase